MRIFAILALIAGVFLAGGAVYYMYGQFQIAEMRLRNQQPEVVKVPTTTIVIAKRPLKYGSRVTAEDVKAIEWPKDHAPDNAFNEVEELFSPQGEWRYALREMLPNEPIIRKKVTGFGELPTLEVLLDPGMVAFTMPVNAESSVGGAINPGSLLDVIMTENHPFQGPKTYRFLQAVKVIAVDQTTDPTVVGMHTPRTITIQESPERVNKLIAAQQNGSITFTLRGFSTPKPSDEERIAQSDVIVHADLFDRRQRKAPPPKQKLRNTVTERRGVAANTVDVTE